MKPIGPVFDAEWRSYCRVVPITRHMASRAIAKHYLGKWPGVTVLTLGLLRNWEVLGVCVFALPPRETAKRYGCTVWELARLWIDDAVPTNAETFLIGRSIRYVRQHHKSVGLIVSYADPSAGHSGTIYKASNWKPDGRTDEGRKTPRVDYVCAETGKKFARSSHIPDGTQVNKVPRVSKFRFVYPLEGAA
jgi:hypothetical protein